MGSTIHSLLNAENSGLSSGWAGHHSQNRLPTLSACALRVGVSKNKVQKDFVFGVLAPNNQSLNLKLSTPGTSLRLNG